MNENWKIWRPAQGKRSVSHILRYAFAAVLVLAAVCLTESRPVLASVPYIFFLGAIIVSALLGGLGPGFLATALSAAFRGCYEFQLNETRKMGRFCKFHLQLASASFCFRQGFPAEIQRALLWCQVPQQVPLLLDRCVQQRMVAQQDGGVSQQAHAPSQTQAVEEYLAQPQLVLLVRLGRLDPGAYLLEQSLGRQTGQGQQTQQSFVITRGKSKLPLTDRGFPAALAKSRLAANTKPMAIFQRSVFQPAQRLTLRTLDSVPVNVGRYQIHVALQFGHYCHPPTLPTSGFGFSSQIAHISNDNRRPPRPASLAITQAGHKESALRNIGRSSPTHQRHQHYSLGVLTPPQPQCVLLVADKATALPSLERTTTQRGTRGRVTLGFFFLKPPHDAGKSVASISATA